MRTPILILTLLAIAAFPVHAQNRTGTVEVRELYDANCAACHGPDLAGGSGGSLIDDEWLHGSSDEEIAAAIRKGIPSALPCLADSLICLAASSVTVIMTHVFLLSLCRRTNSTKRSTQLLLRVLR